MAAKSPKTSSGATLESGSFRDPDSRVFELDGDVLRGLTAEGVADWEAFAASGLLSRLTEAGELVETEATDEAALDALRAVDPRGGWVAALRHERVPVVSYPYEWTSRC